jgi:hypothetical protein
LRKLKCFSLVVLVGILTTTLSIEDITVPMDSDMSATKTQIVVNINILESSKGCEVRGYVITRYIKLKKIVGGVLETTKAA